MSASLKTGSAALIVAFAAACTSVKPSPSAPAVRSSEEIAKRIETVAGEDFSPERADVATALRAFARAYQETRKYSVAEILYQRALAIQEADAPDNNEAMAQTLRDFISLYRAERNWTKADLFVQRYVDIAEKVTGPNNFRLIQDLQEFAGFYEQEQQQYAKAEPLLKRALAVAQSGRAESGMAPMVIDRLAKNYRMQGKSADAEQLFKETLAAQEKTYGENNPRLSIILRQYASLLREMGRTDEAERLDQRAQELTNLFRAQSQSSSNPPTGGVRVPFRREP
jgi:tetratricopeptide (TPR) repeat protein